MTGGLMQLVACGAQDIFLTGSPMISYFKTVYRRHTNFAIETVKQNFDTAPGFGVTTSCTLSRNGDLVTGAYIQATLPDLTEKPVTNFSGPYVNGGTLNDPGRRYVRWIDNVGHYLIKSVEVSIGGSLIDRHYSDWLEIWAQLTVPAGKMPGYRKMIGQDPKNALGQNTGLQADVLTSIAALDGDTSYTLKQGYIVGRDIFVPLQFWFCRNVGLALPLIALQYSDVRIQVTFRSAEDLIQVFAGDVYEAGGYTGWVQAADYGTYVSHGSLNASLWVDYVFLDADERRRFAQVSHEYLIEQVQYQEDTCTSECAFKNIDLNFSHPVKELIFIAKGFEGTREWSNFTNTQLPEAPPFQALQIENNQLMDGLTGLPGETYIAPAKLSMSILTDVNVTGQIDQYFTVTPKGYSMMNGDVITINTNGHTETNVELTVLQTVNGVATMFYTNDYLINQLAYNTVQSILRTKNVTTAQPQVTIQLRSTTNQAYGTINSTTPNVNIFDVSSNNFIMELNDIIQITDATGTISLTMKVNVVTSGVATQFYLTTQMNANVLYNKVKKYVRGTTIDTNPFIRMTFNLIQNGITSPSLTFGTELKTTAGLTPVRFFIPYSYNPQIGDVLTVADSTGNNIISMTIDSLASDNNAIEFSVALITGTLNTFLTVTSVKRNGQIISNDLTAFNVQVSVAASKQYTYRLAITFSQATTYVFKIGDVITVRPSSAFTNTARLTVTGLDVNGVMSRCILQDNMNAALNYNFIDNIQRDGFVVLKNDLFVNLRSKVRTQTWAIGDLINVNSTLDFTIICTDLYVMNVGDIIVLTSFFNLSSRLHDMTTQVTQVNNGVATELKILSASLQSRLTFGLSSSSTNELYNLTYVISIQAKQSGSVALQINFQTVPLNVTQEDNLSDIKTYDDLMRFSNYDSVRPYNSVTGLAGNPISTGKILMNGADRIMDRPGSYFSLMQARQHHTNIPVSPGINIFSFALKPEEFQPSGTCNFSRIEDATLRVKTGKIYQDSYEKPNTALQMKIFAVNYNILRIISGMGGLAYN